MKYWLPLLLLVASCFARTSLMTQEEFNDVALGSRITDVTAKVGEPYAIHDKGDNTQEYEYIEKVNVDGETISASHYYLTVVDGQVVKKRVSRERPPAYDIMYEDDPNQIDW